jgi:hypothetical protein
MPKNTVSDPITDQEMAFAHLILSGTMNDRRAAEAVGLNPDTASYTKAKPRVRAYMIEHRAAVREKLVDQEAAGLRKLNLGRDQILDRLWELANLSSEATRGSISGQVKAISMIVAIEGLIPSEMNARRSSPSVTQPAAPRVEPPVCTSATRREQQEPGDSVAPTNAQRAAHQVPKAGPAPGPVPRRAASTPTDRNLDLLISQVLNRNPLAANNGFDALLDAAGLPGQPYSIKRNPFVHCR